MSGGFRFCKDWNPQQELKLLEAIEEFGYGNWPSIGVKVGKTPTECKSHYDHYYVNLQHSLIPDMPMLTRPPAGSHDEVGPSQLVKSDADMPDYYPGMEISGYMPYRGDFAVEPDNTAESVIANLDPDPEDDEVTAALQLTAVQIYQSKLAARAARKRVVLDYGLLDIQKQIAVDETRLSRRQLWIKNMSRPFMRFMSPTNAAKFLQSHYLEAQLISEIKKLRHYRQNAIKTFKGVALYERLSSERKRRKANRDVLLRKNCTAEENVLYQMLHQGPLKPKKPVCKEAKLLDITYSAGVEKLSTEEKELCSMCRFQPEAYLQFKRILLSEFRKSGTLTLAEARKLLRIDVNKTRKVYDFLKGTGLILDNKDTTNAPAN